MPVGTATRHCGHFIDGQYVDSQSGATFDSINPATGAVHATVALGSQAEIDLAVTAAQRAFENGSWRRLPMSERCRVLRRIGDIILERREELALAESTDTGKPISETIDGDIPRAAQNFHFFADFAESLGEECYTAGPDERHLALREPLGVAGLITPWNLPLYLATWKAAPCLAMGNSCVLKPAEWTPYTATLLGEIATAAGLPPGVLNVVHGFGAGGAGEALTRHRGVDCISFTGETTTGQAIMRACADSLKKVSFELGGKGATVVFADADFEPAVETAVRAAFRNQGQICLAGSRIFVESTLYDRFVDSFVERVRSIKVGDPLDRSTQMGAIISREQLDKVLSYIELGRKEGRLLCGGERLADYPEGNFLSPSVFVGLPHDSRFCRDEIFGPTVPIIPFASEQEALAMVNDTSYGLSSSIWSSDVDRCHRMSAGIRTGIVWVNCWFARDLRTPFGGRKLSGIGREGGRYSLEFFSEAKTIAYRYKQA